MEFRFYLVDEARRIVAVDAFEADSHAEALQEAAIIFDTCRDSLAGYELWCGAEVVMTNRDLNPGRLPTWDQLSRRRQQFVCDREQILYDSFACVRNSRKLLETLSARADGGNAMHIL